MAIHTEQEVQISGGFTKEIEASSMHMMLDILQKYQYQYPIKSSVRELVSNGLDAISEREIAKSILLGEKTVEEFYAEKEGAIYNDSKFDKDYYDLQHFSNDPKVTIYYHEGKGMDKDYVEIIDNGVGLGGRRLEKYFSLGFSSKRLNKYSLGKFGLNITGAIAK